MNLNSVHTILVGIIIFQYGSTAVEFEESIHRGQNAEDGQFPFQVSLRIDKEHICGGSIVSKDYIVTAAHCLETDDGFVEESKVSIYAGSINRNAHGIAVAIKSYQLHPDYEYPENDVAVLELTNSLEINSRIQPIKLAKEWPPVNSTMYLSGWGQNSTRSGVFPIILQYIITRTISYDDCNNQMDVVVPETAICFQDKPRQTSCAGDSGGPAQIDGLLYGISSFTGDTCGGSKPVGYASVPYFYDWIVKNAKL